MSALPYIMVCLGALGFADSFLIAGPARFWANWVVWMLMLASAGLGALFIVAIEHLTGARWSIPLRRTAERVASLLFPASALLVLGLLSLPALYPWTKPGWPENALQAGKTAWLNIPFFSGRAAACAVLWLVSWKILAGGSIEQDTTRDPGISKRAIRFSPVFLAFFALTVTVLAFDWVSSLSPEWFSDVIGVYLFAGVFLSGLAAVSLVAIHLLDRGRLKGVGFDHLYNLGGFLFAFTVFWSYIAFAQYMLMWYAHLPEEIFWYKDRVEGPWGVVTLVLAAIHFVIPFFILVPKDAKGDPRRLRLVAVLILLSHYSDLCWLVFPSAGLAPSFTWTEASAALLFTGLALLWTRKAMTLGEDMPVGDPRLEEGLSFRLTP